MKRHILPIIFIAVLVCSLAAAFVSGHASADVTPPIITSNEDLSKATYVQINADTIRGTFSGGTVNFFHAANDTNGSGPAEESYFRATGYTCTDKNNNFIRSNPTSGFQIELQPPPQVTAVNPNPIGGCTGTPKRYTIKISSTPTPTNPAVTYLLSKDKTTITSLDGSTTFTQNLGAGPNGAIYVNNGDSNACHDIMVTNDAKTSYKIYSTTYNTTDPGVVNATVPGATYDPACKYKDADITGSIGPASTASNPPGTGTGSGSGSPAETDEIKCSVQIIPPNPLTWLVCPIVNGIQSFVDLAENTITSYLTVPGQFFQTDGGSCSTATTTSSCSTGDAIFAAWDSVRNIALALLGITALIMVISQALSFGPFDAYTVKKVLPRILIAAILITLSWSIVQLVVAASNGIGDSVRSLIYVPFKSLKDFNPSGSTELAGNLALVGGLGFLGLFGLLSFALTAFISLVTGLAIIIVRQMVVILLAILAPIAIAAYILPGTDKIFKFWRDGLVGALVLFPIIEAIFAIGAVFSKIAQTNIFSSGANTTFAKTFSGIVAFAAVVIPPFVLAGVARRINGVVGTISGMGHDVSKSLHGRVGKYRATRAADRFKRAQGESLWNPTTRRGKIGNKIATWATAPGANLAYAGRNIPGLSGQGQKIASQVEHAKIEQSSNLLKELNENGMYNDKAYRALSGAHAGFSEPTRARLQAAGIYGKAPRSLKELQTTAHILSQSDSASEQIAANALEGNMGRLASLYSDPEMGKAGIQAAGIMGLSSHGFADGEDLATVANDMADGGKNRGFAQAIASRAQVLGQQQRPDIKAGYGLVYKDVVENGKTVKRFVNGLSPEGNRAAALITTLNSHDLAAAKGGAITAMRPTIESGLRGEIGTGAEAVNNATAIKEQLYNWAGPYSQASVSVKAEALDIINRNGYRAEFDARSRAEVDPTRRGLGGDPGAGGGGGAPATP